jgi:hypothetical protein
MRTLIIILVGFALWGAGILAARIFAGASAAATMVATVGFVALWFVVAAWNMYVGVTQAGYSVLE